MKTENDLLNERLGDNVFDAEPNKLRQPFPDAREAAEVAAAPPTVGTTFDFCQWSAESNETFRPSGTRRETLPSGVYKIGGDQRGIFFQRIKVLTDKLIELDDSASQRVIHGIRKFWSSKAEYEKRGIIFKRGVLLWGPAGSGKTATLAFLTNDLLRADGLVILCESPDLTDAALQVLRRIEPERPLIVLYEDIDELINRWGEHGILALLDGENQIGNVVNLATTNYPERLGARIVNRPSRFDERILIDMPSAAARHKYLASVTQNESIDEKQLSRWVEETEGFSIAHLRELVVAVFCLKQDYESVIERLSKMCFQPRSRDEFKRPRMGLADMDGSAMMPMQQAGYR